MKRVLFISPYMGRTGSEKAILQIINNCTLIQPALFSGQNGTLLNEVIQSIPVYINPLTNINKNRIQRINNKFGLKTPLDKYLDKIQKEFQPDLWILNTLVNNSVIEYLKKSGLSFAVWSHELFSSFENISGSDLAYIIDNAKFIIGCSVQVCQQFEKAGAKKVELFYETIDISKIKEAINTSNKSQKQLGKYKHVFVMSGQKGFRKGFHLLPEIAQILANQKAALVWMGKSNDYGLEELINRQIKNLKLENVFFTNELSDDYYNWFETADYFLLTSIEDPYPLVMLEAAYLQKPIIAFNSGGANEFIKQGMGTVVTNSDISALEPAISELIEGKTIIDKNLLRSEAERHDIKIRIKEFEKIVLSYL